MTLKDILKKYEYIGNDVWEYGDDRTKDYEKYEQEIKDYFINLLPPEVKGEGPMGEMVSANPEWDNGQNFAIKKMKEAIENG